MADKSFAMLNNKIMEYENILRQPTPMHLEIDRGKVRVNLIHLTIRRDNLLNEKLQSLTNKENEI